MHAFGTRKDTEPQNSSPLTEHTSSVSWSHGAVIGWQLQAHESHLHLHTLLYAAFKRSVGVHFIV